MDNDYSQSTLRFKKFITQSSYPNATSEEAPHSTTGHRMAEHPVSEGTFVDGNSDALAAMRSGQHGDLQITENDSCSDVEESNVDFGRSVGAVKKRRSGLEDSIPTRLYERLVIIYKYMTTNSVVENAREMRFALRLIVASWLDLINEGTTLRREYLNQAYHAVDRDNEGIEDVRFLTAKTVCNIIEKARWGGRARSGDHIHSSQTLREVYEGIKITIKELDSVLEEDGTQDEEFSDAEMSEGELEDKIARFRPLAPHPAPTEEQRRCSTVPIVTTVDAKGNILSGPSRPLQGRWHPAEDNELRRIGNSSNASWEDKAKEFNSCMAESRRRAGKSQRGDRTKSAVKSRWYYLNASDTLPAE